MKGKTEQEFKNLIKENKYQVFILACRASAPFGFVFHPWFVLNKKGKISRWEIRHFKNNPHLGYLFLNKQSPFQGLGVPLSLKKRIRKTMLVTYIEGDENSLAQKIIKFIEKSKESYPYKDKYFIAGPNSNTYIKWVFDNFPEFSIELPWSFIGKNYKVKK